MQLSQFHSIRIKTDPRSLRERAQEKLKQLVRTHEFFPGSKLPAEPELSAMLGISRSTLREVINSLEDQNIVVRRHGVGTFVCSIDKQNLEELLEMRFMMECYAAKKVVQRPITQREADAWREILDHFQQLSDKNELALSQPEFHYYLIGLAHNPHLSKAYADLVENIDVMRVFTYGGYYRRDENYSEHLALFNAVLSKDCDRFETVLKDHINSGMQQFLSKYSELQN